MYQIHLRIKLREKPTAAEEISSCLGETERRVGGGIPVWSSLVPLPGLGAPESWEMLRFCEAPKKEDCKCPLGGGGGGGGAGATLLSLRAAALGFFQLLPGKCRFGLRKAKISLNS